MKIIVKLFATLRENRGKVLEFQYSENVTPKDIINQLEIPEAEVAILLINGRDGDLNKTLKDNDVLSIFPPVGGG